MRRTRRYIRPVVFVGIMLLATLTAFFIGQNLKVIPAEIHRDFPSAIFVPSDPVRVDRTTVKYAGSNYPLNFVAHSGDHKLTISEQPSPDSFFEIPDAYSKFVTSFRPYDAFESRLGRVELTRPQNYNNKQVAIMNTKGTLILISAETDMGNEDWKSLFNSLVIEQ